MKRTIAVLLTLAFCLSLFGCSSGEITNTHSHSDNISGNAPTISQFDTNVPLTINATFTFLHDGWNIYKAIQLSETSFKIENWYRSASGDYATSFAFDHDVCVISTTDTTIDFQWLDDMHSAFSVTLFDEDNSHMDEPVTAYFAIETTGNESVFTFQHDEWNMYKAIQLSETTFKIENWYRSASGVYATPFNLDHDVCVISTTDTTIDFQWLDDTHTAFSVTFFDEDNPHMDEPVTAYFSIEASDSDTN